MDSYIKSYEEQVVNRRYRRQSGAKVPANCCPSCGVAFVQSEIGARASGCTDQEGRAGQPAACIDRIKL